MKQEKYIKDILQDYESPMELDVVWSNLDQALDQADPATKTGGMKLFSLKKFFPFLLLVIVSVSGFYAYQNFGNSLLTPQQKTTDVIPQQMASSHQYEAIESTPNQVLDNKADKHLSPIAATTSNLNTGGTTTTKPVATASTTPTSKLSSESLQTSSKLTTTSSIIAASSTVSATNSSTTQEKNSFPLAKDKNTLADIKLPVLKMTENGLVLDNQNVTLPNLNQLANTAYFLDHNRVINPNFILEEMASSNKIIPVKSNGLRLSIHGGATAAINDVTVEGLSIFKFFPQPDSKSDTELERLVRPTFGIQLDKVFASGLKLSTGLNYLDQGRTTVIIDTVSIVDSEIERETSSITINEKGQLVTTTTVTLLRESTIARDQTNSNLNTLQVPLMIGYEKQLSNFDLGFSLGLGLNYTLGGSPASVNEIEPLDATGISFSGLADLQLGYKIDNRIRIYGSLIGGRHFSDLSNPAFATNPLRTTRSTLNHYGLRAGISYLL